MHTRTRRRVRRIARDTVLVLAAGAAALAAAVVATAHIVLPIALAPLRVLAHLIGATP